MSIFTTLPPKEYKYSTYQNYSYFLKLYSDMKTLSEFLKKHNLWGKYLSYSFKYDNRNSIYYYSNNMFPFKFNETKEGLKFWNNIETEYDKHVHSLLGIEENNDYINNYTYYTTPNYSFYSPINVVEVSTNTYTLTSSNVSW